MTRIVPILAVVALWASPLAAQPSIHVSAGNPEIQIGAIEPGAKVALLSVHRKLEGYVTVAGGLRRFLVGNDRDGSVSIHLDEGVPLASLWIAVDLASGQASVAWPEGFEPLPLMPHGLRLAEPENTEGSSTALVMPGRLLEVFLVRPGEAPAVWHRTLANGGPVDEEPDPSSMVISVQNLDAVTEVAADAPSAPTSVMSGDVFVLLDPTRLRWQIVRGETLLDNLPGKNAEAAHDAMEGVL